jgi:prophage regulatory protein
MRRGANRKEKAMQLVHESRAVVPRDRLLRIADVLALTALGKSTIYQLMREGKFPKCVRITRRMVAWPESAVLQWVQDRINSAAGAAAEPSREVRP